jgi:hypothetical protein
MARLYGTPRGALAFRAVSLLSRLHVESLAIVAAGAYFITGLWALVAPRKKQLHHLNVLRKKEAGQACDLFARLLK